MSDLFCDEIPEPLLVDSNTIDIDQNFLEKKLKKVFIKNREKNEISIENNQSILKAKALYCINSFVNDNIFARFLPNSYK